MLNFDTQTISERLVNAALNGVLQGLLLTLLMAVFSARLRSLNAASRHWLWFGLLLIVPALIPAQLWRDRSAQPHLLPTPAAREELAATRDVQLTIAPLETETGVAFYAVEPNETAQFRDRGPAKDERPGPASSSYESFAAKLRPTGQRSWQLNLGPSLPRGASQILVGLWAVTAACRLVLLLLRLRALRKMKRRSLPPTPELDQVFQALRSKLGVARPVKLRLATAEPSAMVLGFAKPVVLFPAQRETPIDLQGAEPILAHELAHVHRRDDWLNLAQQLIGAVFFFQPAVRWIGRRLELERGIACDDLVLHHGGIAQKYALLLVNLAERKLRNQPLLAPGVSSGRHQLQQRIHMILDTRRNISPQLAKTRLGLAGLSAAAVATLVLYAGPRLVLAQNSRSAELGTSPESSQASAELASPERVPAIEIVQSESSDAAPANIDSAQKPKAESSDTDVAPQPGRASHPRPAVKPVSPALPKPPRAPEGDAEARIEERVARLEKMVQMLLARQEEGHASLKFSHPHQNGPADLDAFNDFKFEAERDFDRASEFQKRAAKQAEKAMKFEMKGKMQEGFNNQVEALQRQRETLQREMQKLERQIERVKTEHAKIQDEVRRRQAEQNEESESK